MNLNLSTLKIPPDIVDLSGDRHYSVDRRIVLALAAIIDSPEEG